MESEVLVVTDVELLIGECSEEVLVEQVVTTELLEVAEQGPPGPPGNGVTVKGAVNALGELPSGAAVGDMYVLSTNNHGHVWDGSAWIDTGPIQGPQGLTGPAGATGASGANGTNGLNGLNGADGESAYAVAVSNGFIGNEAAWLASLVGPSGLNGSNGTNGTNGLPGADGAGGADGESAYELALTQGFVGTLAQWLASLVGATGSTGAAGADGVDGADGSAGAPGVGVPAGGTAGQVLAKTSATNYATAWVDPATGAVTSVAVSVPAGLSVAGTPITASGTFVISYQAGYSIPTNAKQADWDTAFGWGNHASAGYLTSAAIGVSVQAYAANLSGWAALATAAKQDALVSGTSIKTVNGTSLLGAGDIVVTGGGGVAVSATAPASPTEGDQWFDTNTGIQYTRVGTTWVDPN